MKKQIYQLYPDIAEVTSSEDTVCEAFWKALEAWILTNAEIMKRLIESIDRRVKAVIDVEGWYTNYINRLPGGECCSNS